MRNWSSVDEEVEPEVVHQITKGFPVCDLTEAMAFNSLCDQMNQSFPPVDSWFCWRQE